MDSGDGETPTSKTSGTKPRKGIQSLVTGFKVIDFLIKSGKPVPMREIVKGTGLSPSKLQFYLVSLQEVRVVHQDSQSGYYGLGPYTLQLGIAGLQQFDIFEACRERLEQFATAHGHTVFLGVWGNEGPTIIYRASGANAGSLLELKLGTVLPVLRSALGRAFLAFLPDTLTRSHIDRELANAQRARFELDDEMPVNLASLNALREAIRERRLSRCRGGLLSDHTAVSAPIFDYRDKIIASITVMAPTNAIDDSYDGPIARELREIADEISQEAGQTTSHYLNI